MKPNKLMVSIAAIICLMTANSCKHQNEKSSNLVFVEVALQLDGPGYQISEHSPHYVTSSGTSSAAILAIPATISSILSTTDMSSMYDMQMLDTTDNTVTMLLPLETSLRIVKASFEDELTLAQVTNDDPTPLFIGLSEPLTIDADTTSKAVEVVMQEVVVVSSTYPRDASTDVILDTSVVVNFNKAMTASTITTSTDATCSGSFQVSSDDFTTCVAMSDATADATNDSKQFTVTPAATLSASTTYKIKVTTDAQSSIGAALEGIYTSSTGFTTAAAIFGPSVTSTNPADATTDVAVDTIISITFSQPMAGTGIFVGDTTTCDNHIQVSGDDFSTCVPMTGSNPTYSNGNQTLTIVPASDLSTNTTYKIRVTGDTQGGSGEEMGSTYTSTTGFTTAAVAGPSISSTSPADGATDVAVNTSISIIFSQAMAAGISTNTSSTTCDGHIRVSNNDFSTCVQMSAQPTYSNSDQTLTITPASDLSLDTIYKIQISADTSSASGLEMGSWYESATGFTTTATPATSLIGGTIQGNDLSLARTASWFAGDGATATSVDGTGTAAVIPSGYGITTDGTYLYVSDVYRSVIRRILISSGVVDTIAGLDGDPATTDGDGTSARFFSPAGMTTDGTYLHIADYLAHNIRRITLTSPFTVITIAGDGTSGYADAAGTSARFDRPYGVTYDDTDLYVADRNNCAIRKITLASPYTVSNLAGSDSSVCADLDGVGTAARFGSVSDVTISNDKTTLYVTDADYGKVKSIDISSRTVTTIATGFTNPRGLTTDGTNIYVSDTDVGNTAVFAISTPGTVSTLTGSGTAGCAEGTGVAAQFDTAKGLTVDGTYLYVSVSACGRIVKIQ